MTAPVPRTPPPVQDFEERLVAGQGMSGGGGRSSKVERWMFIPEASRRPRPGAGRIRCMPRGARVGGGSEQVAPLPRTEAGGRRGWRPRATSGVPKGGFLGSEHSRHRRWGALTEGGNPALLCLSKGQIRQPGEEQRIPYQPLQTEGS